MYLKSNPLFKSLANKRWFNSATFKYSANTNSKDCIRLAFIYGMCGTFASYLSMNYDGKVLVFKWSVPTPERFVFCTWCFSLGGMASWMLFWTRPDALIRAASSRIRYGLFHGTQTTSLALMLSFGTIGLWSVYFDVKEWQNRYGEWQKSLNTINTLKLPDISNTLIEEEGIQGNEDDSKVNIVNMDEIDIDVNGAKIINNKLNNKLSNKLNNKLGNDEKQQQQQMDVNKLNELRDSRPTLTYQIITSNMYEPCKLFFMCNAPIWLICGSFTGMVAARILTNAILLNPVNVTTASAAFATVCCVDKYNDVNDDDTF